MSILEQFKAFAEALPEDRRHEIEAILASLMEAEAPEYQLTSDEAAEIDRRRAHPGAANIDDATFRAKLRKSIG